MKIKELKQILNSRTDLDNCEVKIDMVDLEGGTCVPIEHIECGLRYYDSYDGAIVYLIGLTEEEANKGRDKDPSYQEVKIETNL
jgi:hypothetical protein